MEASSPDPDAATGATRRKSGRVVKKPEIFGTETPVGSVKRKRTNKDPDEVDMDGHSSEDESDESEGEPDAEEQRESRQKPRRTKKAATKPAQKKPKMNGQTTSLAIRPAKERPRNPKKASRTLKNVSEDESKGIYGQIFAHGEPTENVIAEWLKRFDEHEAAALAEVVNFVLLCSGCDLKVNEHDIQDPDSCTGKLSDIQDEYQAQNITEYPLTASRARSITMKNGLVDFFKVLVQTIAASSVLFKNIELMENIEVWISTMSSAANRPFRHTATVASLAVITGLAQVGKEMMDNSSQTLRQSEGERKKGRVNKARVSEMEKKVREAAERQESLDHFAKDWFDAVFVHRYRDVDTRIRSDCVEALGEWIVTYPELFFDGHHLRYLGWVLSDTVGATRLEVVKQLQRLYSDKDRVGGLKTFTERFRARLVEMATRDADLNVRIATVELLDILREAGLLEPDDIDAVGKLIFDSEARVRKAVTPFFVENINDLYESKIEDLGGQEALDDALPQVSSDEDFETPRVEWLKLKCLVEMLESYDAESDDPMDHIEHGSKISTYIILASGWESRFSLAAQALCDQVPEIEDWVVLAGYLLYDHSALQNGTSDDPESQLKQECKLTEKAEVMLLEILNASVESAANSAVRAVHDRRAKKSKAEKREILESQEEDAQKLSIIVPRLLKKFGSSPEAASVVLRLEHVLNLEVFQELRQGSTTYSDLLDDINRQFLSHGSENVLREASGALLHAKAFEELAEVTEGKLQALWDDTMTVLRNLKKGKDLSKRGSLGNSAIKVLSTVTLRIANLSSISSCIEPLEHRPVTSGRSKSQRSEPLDGVAILVELITRGVPHDDADEETEAHENAVVNNVCRSLLFYFMWQRKELEQSIMSDIPVASDTIESLASRWDAVRTVLADVINTRRGTDELRLQAAGFVLDFYTLFATVRDIKPRTDSSGQKNADYLTFAQEMPLETQQVLEHVLTAAEKQFAKRSRRTLEVADDDEPVDTDEDPESDSEDEDDEEDSRGANQHASLIAEQQLCEFTSKIVLAIAARVFDAKGKRTERSMTQRLQRNKTRLGQNFKDVVTFLEGKKASSRAKPKPKAKPSATDAPLSKPAKSAEIVVEDEEEDEQEEQRVNDNEEDEDALREKGLVVDEHQDDEAMDEANGADEE